MKKFTVFTLILAVIAVIMASEMWGGQYFPGIFGSENENANENSDFGFNLPDSLDVNDTLQTNVLGADIDYSGQDDLFDLSYEEIPMGDSNALNDITLGASVGEFSDEIPRNVIVEDSFGENTAADFEDSGNFQTYETNVYIREDQIRSAGFSGAYLEKEPHNGMLYKTILVDDLSDLTVTKYVVKTDTTLFAKVYTIMPGPNILGSEIYEVLKLRASEGLDIEINETNEYGDNSFYMNDARRQTTAFLTARFGNLIYGFSYPKDYHTQITNLAKLIDLEF